MINKDKFAAFLRKAGATCSEESEEENQDEKDERGGAMGARQMGGNGMYPPNVPVQQGGNACPPGVGGGSVNPYSGFGGFGPGMRQKKDNSAERQMLELQLVGLRQELEDAKHDARMSGIQQIGTLTTSMRVQNIMRQIQEIQGRLLQLQN